MKWVMLYLLSVGELVWRGNVKWAMLIFVECNRVDMG